MWIKEKNTIQPKQRKKKHLDRKKKKPKEQGEKDRVSPGGLVAI